MEIYRSLSISAPFFALEGLDGSGTTTQTQLLANFLSNRGYGVLKTQAPSNSLWGGRIRLVLNKYALADPLSLAFAFVADRVNHIARISYELKSHPNDIVTSDRFHLSFLAYQNRDTEKSLEWLFQLLKGLPFPNITFFLDVSPEECLKRIRHRAGHDIYENYDTLTAVRRNFLSGIKFLESRGLKIITLPGEESQSEIQSLIRSEVLAFCEHRLIF